MSDEKFTTIEFRVEGNVVESVPHPSVPRVGETVEVGVQFDENGDRLDPSVDYDTWFNGSYETVLEAKVVDITRHYHRGYGRDELTVYVDVEPL